MKLPRRKFLHLTAGVAVLPMSSRFAWAQASTSRPVRAPPRGDFTMAMLDQMNA